MVRSTAIPLLILAGMALTPTTVCAGSITYNIVNYPTSQNGFTVMGTITTNGSTGTHLPSTDITSWDFTISSGVTPIATFNSSNPGNRNDSATFDATSSELSVPTLPDAVRFDLFIPPTAGLPVSFIRWGATISSVLSYTSGTAGVGGWSDTLPPDSPIATTTAIPEPSSVVLATIGAVVAFLAYGRSRHRRVQHRLESD